MIELISQEKKKIGLLKDAENECTESVLSSGDKTISFRYPKNGRYEKELECECYLRTKKDEFVLKEIEIDGDWISCKGNLNLEELEGKAFEKGFETVEQTVRSCIDTALSGTGWCVGECNITKKRTIRKEQACNALEIIQQCIKTYNCEIKFDTLNRKINIYEEIGENKGCYFIESVNLRKLKITKNTYSFYTRIVPIGKDNLKIDIDGKDYIENNEYSPKTKTLIWRDDRYTRTDALIEDATYKLNEMSKPYVVYEADINDLAKKNEVYKNILDYSLGDTVILVSKQNGVREKQRITKIVEYENEPEKNTCELSNTTKSFAEIQREEIDNNNNATQQEINDALNEATTESGKYTDKEIKALKEYTEEELTKADEKINSRAGLFYTDEIKTDGSHIYYIHDKEKKEESKIIWKMTADSIAVSTDGGKNYSHGITADGDAIFKIIKAKGIETDYLIAGTLIGFSLKSANDKFSIDKNGNITIIGDYGTLKITSNSFIDLEDKYEELNLAMAGIMIHKGQYTSDLRKGSLTFLDGQGTAAFAYSLNGKSLMLRNDHVFQCLGTLYYGSLQAWSDERLKDIEGEIGEEYDAIIEEIRKCIYTWKDKEHRDGKKHFGFIAQEIKQRISDDFDIVKEDKNGMLSVNYVELIPVIAGMLSRCKKRIENLEIEVKKLKGGEK